MAKRSLIFNGQHHEEDVVAFTRHHWLLVLPYFLGLILLIMFFAGVFVMPLRSWFATTLSMEFYMILAWPLALGLTYALHRLFTQIINYYLKVIVITDFRIIDLDRTLVFCDTRDALDLSKIQDVILHKDGLMQSLFNYGELVITMPAVNLVKKIRFVPNPDYFYHRINEMRMRHVASARLREQEVEIADDGEVRVLHSSVGVKAYVR